MKQKNQEFRYLIRTAPPILVCLLVLSIVGMNLLANKSIDLGLNWIVLDCGILFSWVTFLCLDVLTQCYGPYAATVMSITALALDLFMAAMFYIASILPGVWGESYVEGSEEIINLALNHTFKGTWYIILGSSIAFATSTLVNNYLNHLIGKLCKKTSGFGVFAARSYISTFLAQFVDNFVFALLVSRNFFGWTLPQCVICAFLGALMELAFEVFFSPIGYQITKALKKDLAEQPKGHSARLCEGGMA